ncbi:MAG: PqqD family protein [Porphyromonadaceae bacterium]|nr:PqqD family protein [Porphyromonadaceae bacterium]
MRLNDNFAIRKIADEYIMVAHVENSLDYTRAIGLNETTVYLLESLSDREFDVEDMARLLVEKYEVNYEQALADAEILAQKLIELGISAA